MAAWDTTAFLASVKRRAGVPYSQATFSTTEVLTLATEELVGYIVPLVTGVREDLWLCTEDQALTDATARYRIPYRATGSKLREVSIIDVTGFIHNIPRVDLADLEVSDFGFTVEGDSIVLINDGAFSTWRVGVTLRQLFHCRPNALIPVSEAGVVSTFNVSAKTITLVSAPAGFTGNTSWDIIRARSPFDLIAFDAAGTLAGSTITFTEELPDDLAAGDYVCLREQSPVPQLPVELHPLLAQKTAVKILESLQMDGPLGSAREELVKLEKDATQVIKPRVDGEAKVMVNRSSPYRWQ